MQKNKYINFICVFILLVAFGVSNELQATHVMGGNITYNYLEVTPQGTRYAVTLSLFRDCKGITLSSNPLVTATSSTCGSATAAFNPPIILKRTPLCPSAIDRCDNNAGTWGLEEWIFRGTITLPTNCGTDWVISWDECCRNNAITNLTNAGAGYLYAELNNTLINNSPAFNNEPTIFLCAGQENRYNGGMTDVENDSLVYSLTNCLTAPGAPVNYAAGITDQQPILSQYTTIDPRTGEIATFPIGAQVAVVCILVEEYRNGQKIGELIRDLQFTVTDCFNTVPILSGINGNADSSGVTGSYQISTCAGRELCFDLEAFDREDVPTAPFQDLQVNWSFGINGASFVVDYSVPYPKATFCWTPTAADVGDNFFFVEVVDDACPLNGYNVYSYNVQVTGGVEVEIAPLDSLDALGLDPGEFIQLSATSTDPNATFAWSPATGLSCTDCPNPVLTATGANFFPLTTTYTCTVTSPQGCSNSDDLDITVFAVSTENIEELKGWEVFPNPISERSILEYQLTESSDVNIEIYNITGQRVAVIDNAIQSSGQHQYDLGQYLNGKTTGVYLLRMSVNGQTATKKLMVK